MKVRNGFVSNSSSSSFVCSQCGESFSGWDGDYGGDIEEAFCVNGHCMDTDCVKDNINEVLTATGENDDEIKKVIDECAEDFWEKVPEKFCKTCGFINIDQEELFAYAKKKFGLTSDLLLEKAREEFSSYKEFLKYIRSK